ncbi:hypothetical protein SAMN03159341_102503 [Paenibacillus sp. 1_12]|uniref:hypothetical protein n=1 Tax=Paenibacillus sp. 1_12 TaxID=1566278 RepID=UPI0008EC8BA7|nr:hypothetical protein [Paenibacillus sp. 1_12]SFK97759.1 hypothetical protein SAMN03159341_102503 [Paenibacillus sp. 1_12]
MIQQLTVYAIVVCTTIGTMLVLCIDVLNRSRPMKLSIKRESDIEIESESDIEQSDVSYEKNIAFPFYVDCSQSSDNNRIQL